MKRNSFKSSRIVSMPLLALSAYFYNSSWLDLTQPTIWYHPLIKIGWIHDAWRLFVHGYGARKYRIGEDQSG